MDIQITATQHGTIGIAAPKDRIDAVNSRALRRHFDLALKKTNQFIFDCRKLDFLDSTGLGALVSCLNKANSAQGELCLFGINPKVKIIFELTQADKLFPIFTDMESALSSFANRKTSEELSQ